MQVSTASASSLGFTLLLAHGEKCSGMRGGSWSTKGRIGLPWVPMRTRLPLIKCPQTTKFISLTYLCPLGGHRFSSWNHVHLATSQPQPVYHWSWWWTVFQSFPQLNPYPVPRWSLWTRVLQTRMVSGAVLAAPEVLGELNEITNFQPSPSGIGEWFKSLWLHQLPRWL